MPRTFDTPPTSNNHWRMVIVSGVLTLLCGAIGMLQYELAHPMPNVGLIGRVSDSLYVALQMLVLHSPNLEFGSNLWLDVGRWCGAFTLVATTTVLLWKRLLHEYRLLRLSRWRNHYVICGLGEKGLEIVKHIRLHNPKAQIVVVDPNPDHELSDRCDAQDVCIIAEDATNPSALKTARVGTAKEIIAITPADETNVRIATLVQEGRSDTKSGSAVCHVHLSNIHLRDVLQRWADQHQTTTTILRFFDVFDNEARRVLLELPLDGAGLRQNDSRTVHVVILGFGRMGCSVALRAAKIGHFANGKPMRISIIDREAVKQRERFLFRFPILAQQKNTCNFHQAEADSYAARLLIEQWATAPDTLLHMLICLNTDAYSVDVGLRLRDILAARIDTTISVRIKSHNSMAAILEANQKKDSLQVRPFGMATATCSEQALRREHNEALARIIHEDFVAARIADTDRRPENDDGLRPWEQLRDEFRESNRQQADHMEIKMRAIGCQIVEVSDKRPSATEFSPLEIEVLAEMEHARWNAERWLGGWHYGETTDKPRLIHNCLVSWDRLPDKIKKYDRETVSKIPRWLSLVQPARKVVRVN